MLRLIRIAENQIEEWGDTVCKVIGRRMFMPATVPQFMDRSQILSFPHSVF